jgi:RNA polymerase sigma-70 factor (ECF subfamily)
MPDDSSEWPDADLVRNIAAATPLARDAEAAICARYAGRIRAYGRRHLRDDDAAADLVQQVLVAVIEAARADRVEKPERLGAFVLGVCRFTVWDLRRGRRRERRATEGTLPLDVAAEPDVHPVDRMQLERCVGQLAPRSATVIRMSFGEDRPAHEIADLLGLTAGNVRVIRHRALAGLQACLDGDGKAA